jgi:hypothetical protein
MDEFAIKTLRSVHRAVLAVQNLWHRGGSLLPPIFKSVLFGLSLWYVQGSGFSTWPVLLFLGVAIVSYMQPVSKAFRLKTSLVVTLSLALLLTSRFTITLPVELHASGFGQLLFAAVFGFLFFILLGIKNVILVRRRQWYAVLFIALVYGISLLFFTAAAGDHTIRDALMLAILMYFLLREYFNVQEHPYHRALKVMTVTVTTLLIQLAWALSLLPLGFSKSASLLALLAMMLAGILDRYIRGTLTARFLRLSFILFIVLVGVVFLSVRWVL